jgi:hypothetical protein
MAIDGPQALSLALPDPRPVLSRRERGHRHGSCSETSDIGGSGMGFHQRQSAFGRYAQKCRRHLPSSIS